MSSAGREVKTFTVARRSLRRKAVTFGLVGSFLIIAISVIRIKEWDLVAILDVACLVGLIWLIALPYDPVLYWISGRNRRLHVGPEGLCLEQGGLCQRVSWNEIIRVHIKAAEDAEPVGVDIYIAEGLAFELQKFERLFEIAELIQAGISPTVPVERL